MHTLDVCFVFNEEVSQIRAIKAVLWQHGGREEIGSEFAWKILDMNMLYS